MACVLLGFFFLAGATLQQVRVPPLESGVVREVELSEPAGTRLQHFRLDRGPARGAIPHGLARWTSGPDPAGGLRVELELLFLESGVRLIHIERSRAPDGADEKERVLVFRELREGGGRTLFLEGDPRGGYTSLESGAPVALRRSHPGPGELPLLLVEATLRGAEIPAQAEVFDPLAAAFEPVRLDLDDGSLVLTRADGSRRWRIAFQDGLPVEFAWQERGPRARAIPRADYERLLSEHEARTLELARQESEAAAPRPLDR
jgi:hypothetical protein